MILGSHKSNFLQQLSFAEEEEEENNKNNETER